MILVIGATGLLGGLIASSLLDQGKPVRILVRVGSPADALVSAGAQAVTGDLKDSDSIRAACDGVDVVITTANSVGRGGDDTVESVDRHGNAALIDAAAAAQVRHLVFISALGASAQHPMPFLQAKGEAEDRLRASGMAWTVLQPNMYMDLWIPPVVGGPLLAGHPVTLVGDGERTHSMIAARDVASFAVAAIDRLEARGQTLVLGGPEPVSWRDVVAAFEHELGQPVRVQTTAVGEPISGIPDTMLPILAGLATYDSPIDMGGLPGAYGVALTPLADFVHDFVEANRR